jgi:hypothetical protein
MENQSVNSRPVPDGPNARLATAAKARTPRTQMATRIPLRKSEARASCEGRARMPAKAPLIPSKKAAVRSRVPSWPAAPCPETKPIRNAPTKSSPVIPDKSQVSVFTAQATSPPGSGSRPASRGVMVTSGMPRSTPTSSRASAISGQGRRCTDYLIRTPQRTCALNHSRVHSRQARRAARSPDHAG